MKSSQLIVWYLSVIFVGLFYYSDACRPYDTVWQAWSPCSRACGGGTQHRHGHSCVWHKSKDEDRKCNEHCRYRHQYINGRCQCPLWRTGTCCELCRHIYINHCEGANKECGGNPDNIMCTKCSDPYYSGGYGGGCRLCPTISHCNKRHCSNVFDTKCKECQDDNVFYKRTRIDTKCERMCSFDSHTCWPGNCSDELTTSCKCAKGFYLVKNRTHTSCQLDNNNAPSINKCQTKIFDANGDGKQTEAGACHELKDFYGNFQPTKLIFAMQSDFTVNVTNSLPRPNFIVEENFGVTDTSVYTKRVSVLGNTIILGTFHLTSDINNSTKAKTTINNKGNYTLPHPNYTLKDGERLCIEFEALGGGYIKTHDFRSNTDRSPVPYKKTQTDKTICYWYDDAKPLHCLVDKTCLTGITEPLQVKKRITRSSDISISFDGWIDPIPRGGNASHASDIELYEITVNEVLNGTIDTRKVFTKTVNNTSKNITFTFTSDGPKLYCINLCVKDVAGNVQYARRFVLYDNFTNITTNGDKPFTVTTASKFSNRKWQTHHNHLCLDWRGHFYNKYYVENSVLGKINTNPRYLTSSIYEQNTGILPVSGTPNIFGITHFRFASSLNSGPLSPEISVPNFLNQTFCKNLTLKDGQTYTLYIKAIDIVNNTYTETRTVHIDRTLPYISNIGLLKNGVRRPFVHDDTDLSKIILSFDALDHHSGISIIDWTIRKLNDRIICSGRIPVITVDKKSCLTNCYCPDVGKCEVFVYNFRLNTLVKKNTIVGSQNQTYIFAIKVTNNAGLSNIERINIFVDDSSDGEGVICEGSKYNEQETDTTPYIAGVITLGMVCAVLTAYTTCVTIQLRRKKTEKGTQSHAISTEQCTYVNLAVRSSGTGNQTGVTTQDNMYNLIGVGDNSDQHYTDLADVLKDDNTMYESIGQL